MKRILVILIVVLSAQNAWGAEANTSDSCTASGGLVFVCGPANAEDLVLVPDTHWVLSSGMLPGGGIYLVDTQRKTWSQKFDGRPNAVEHDVTTYGQCPGPPVLETFNSHGMHIRAGADKHSTLYVVGHGGREAIEVFDVDASLVEPKLTWVGCVPMPNNYEANSVVSLNDGSLLATVLMHPGQTYSEVFSGKITGAVYKWKKGSEGFEKIPGTELPGNNGIEISNDESEIYVVSTGLGSISAFSHTNPAKLLRATKTFDYGPDNIHMTADGQLITAGPSQVDHACGELDLANFDLGAFASCPKASVVGIVDPRTMKETKRFTRPANDSFSNATMALQVGDDVWVGTFHGNRIGIMPSAD